MFFFPHVCYFLTDFQQKIQIKLTGSLWLSCVILIKQFCIILIPLTYQFLNILFGISAHSFPENPSPPFEKCSIRNAFKSVYYIYLHGFHEFESFLFPLHGDTSKILGPFCRTVPITWGDPEAAAHSTSLSRSHLWELASLHASRTVSITAVITRICLIVIQRRIMLFFYYVELFSLDIMHRLAPCLYCGSARIAAAARVWREF